MIEYMLYGLMVLPFVGPPLLLFILVFTHLRRSTERRYWEDKREREFRDYMERCRRMEDQPR